MKRILPVALTVLVLLAVSITLIGMDAAVAAEDQVVVSEAADMEAAKATFEDVCSKCHALSRPLGKKKDRAGWENTVSRMASYYQNRMGQTLSDEDQEAIVQYLLSVAGK